MPPENSNLHKPAGHSSQRYTATINQVNHNLHTNNLEYYNEMIVL